MGKYRREVVETGRVAQAEAAVQVLAAAQAGQDQTLARRHPAFFGFRGFRRSCIRGFL